MTFINDKDWLDANLNPAAGRAQHGISIPDLPPDEIQQRFTGRSGRVDLEQAFEFYRFVLKHMPQEEHGQFRLIDFGGGWGRILRFFLREFSPERLILFDCLTDAVQCARSLNSPYAVEQNEVLPPLALSAACTDCCYAFSVFSHLSASACESWLSHLGELLVPGGKVIVTTRGMAQINSLRKYRSETGPRSYLRRLLRRTGETHHGHFLATLLPHPDEIQRRYVAGEFQHYPTGGGGELSNEFYGETWITEQWIANNYPRLGFRQYDFFLEFAAVDQCVIVLTK